MPNLSEEILKGLSMNPAYLGFFGRLFLEDATRSLPGIVKMSSEGWCFFGG